MKSQVLIVRHSDNAIFERCSAPCRENPPLLLRLEWARYSFWPGGRLVHTGETWQPKAEEEYDFIDRRIVEIGVKELARRLRAA